MREFNVHFNLSDKNIIISVENNPYVKITNVDGLVEAMKVIAKEYERIDRLISNDSKLVIEEREWDDTRQITIPKN